MTIANFVQGLLRAIKIKVEQEGGIAGRGLVLRIHIEEGNGASSPSNQHALPPKGFEPFAVNSQDAVIKNDLLCEEKVDLVTFPGKRR